MNLFKSSIYTLITKVILFFLGIFSSIIVVRLIGAEGKGILSVVETFFSLLVTLSFLSLSSGLIYHINKSKRIEKFINSGLLYSLLLSMFLFILSLIFKRHIIDLFFHSIPEIYFYIGLGLIFLYGFSKITEAFSRAIRNPVIYNSALFLSKVIYVIIILGFWILRIDISAIHVLFALAISLSFNIFYILLFYKRYLSISDINLRSIKTMLSFGIKEHIGVIAGKLNLRLDILIMSALLPVKEIGFYSIAVLFAELVWYIPDSIGVFLYPQIANTNQKKSSAFITAQINRINLATTVMISILLFFLSDLIIPFMYGEEFIVSANVVKILLLGTTGLSIVIILTKYFAGIGKPIISSYSTLIGFAFHIPLLWFLIPLYGIIGSAIASTMTYLIIAIFLIIVFVNDSENSISLRKVLIIEMRDINDLKSNLNFKSLIRHKSNETSHIKNRTSHK